MKAVLGLSLKARLSLLYAVLLILSVVIVGFCSYWNVWQLFINNKSAHLRARAKPIIAHWLTDYGLASVEHPASKLTSETAAILARDLTSKQSSAIILDNTGKIIAKGKRLPEEPDAPPPELEQFKKAMSGENEVTYFANLNGTSLLVMLIPLRPRPGSPKVFGVVQLSTGLREINRMLFRHGAMLMAIVALILILGTVAGYWFIGMSLRDLQGLVKTCNAISSGDFSKRVSVNTTQGEIGRLATSFNQMISQLESIFASQQRFVANAAHELLTPLTGLKGCVEVLLRGAQDDPATTSHLLKAMYREVNRLIRLCEQLLGISRLEGSSHVHRQDVVVSEFFADFMPQARLLANDDRLVLRQGPYARISVDPDLLKQVLFNLLSNALRHSPDDTPIEITWRLLPDFVEIQVRDHGEGMDATTLSHVFEPFYKGRSHTCSYKRSGLGLSLAKSMINAHGGTIKVESAPGKGTIVSFTIPLSNN